MNVIEGDFISASGHYAILVTRWNSFIVERLKEGAIDTLKRHGISDESITLVYVPGALELSIVAKRLAHSGKYSALIALGAVIRGSTAHFDYVCAEQSKGLAQVSLDTGVPVASGVLTVDTIEQSIERAGAKAGNKGSEAAEVALEMVSLISQLP